MQEIQISLRENEVRFILALLQDEYCTYSKQLDNPLVGQPANDVYKSMVKDVKRLIYKIGRQIGLK